MPEPLSTLSPAKQNSRSSPIKLDFSQKPDTNTSPFAMSTTTTTLQPSGDTVNASLIAMDQSFSPPAQASQPSSPRKAFSPIKYRLQDESRENSSPPGSPAEPTVRFNEGLTRALDTMQEEVRDDNSEDNRVVASPQDISTPKDELDELTLTLSLDDKTIHDETVGDLSTISAIHTDMTRFANLRTSPTKDSREAWSPSKQLRTSVISSTPGTVQRPLRLLSTSRRSTSPTEDDEATPRRSRTSNDATTDLLNFTGQTNIIIPPPGSAPRSMRRSPSGRGAFPIKINPSSSHRSQASVDRERAGGRSPQKQLDNPLDTIPATPAGQRHSIYGATSGLGMDLLDIDLGPMATPRSIPTITPRELESLRSELQSRISGLEATLSGKEAEVMALKRAITDAEVRVGKTSEELRNERGSREELEHAKDDLERRSREMEEVLREVKQNIFLEEREKEKLRRHTEEADHRTEELEVRVLELQASLDTLRSDRVKSTPSPDKNTPGTPGMSADIDFAVKDATEKVARELHALYKSKHERKVSDLKVSYEKRWIKQVEQLRADLKASQEEVLKLQTEREATMSGVIPGQSEAMSRMEGQIEELRRWNEETTAEKKMLEAEAAGLRSQMDSLMAETDFLRKDIEQERVEKGDLVAQVDLFLTMSAQQEEQRAVDAQRQPVSPPRSEDGNGRPNSAAAVASPNKFRNSMTGGVSGVPSRQRPMSMLQKPTAGKYSGIPAPGSGLKAPSSKVGGYGGRSGGIIEGIARMGAGGR
ncbi:hypothetical protein EDD36DRAFT_414498 [Exophiala viscosa]|uniref:Uncharacterized protein n=1 Tax=Exophiala viscosa TaxID=2486360 RepID=A0AAN6E654_9EURO|nr:hypothetical protein EDD36DRAFT_414498 [Exophiala viscosa]